MLKPICVEDNGAVGELIPHNGFHLDIEIEFETPLNLRPSSEVGKSLKMAFFRDIEGNRVELVQWF